MQCIMGFLGRHGKQGFSGGQVPKSSSKSDQIRPRKTDLSSGCLVDLGASALLLLLLLARRRKSVPPEHHSRCDGDITILMHPALTQQLKGSSPAPLPQSLRW